MADALEQGRESYRRRAWASAHQSLTRADQMCPLSGGDLELLGTCAYLIGLENDFESVFERAHHAHVADGDQVRAARCAFWLGLGVLLRGEIGRASGWLARARRLLDSRDCVEQGYLLLPDAEQHLGEGDADTAYKAAVRAAGVGDRFRDDDLIACAHHLQGRALIMQGHINHGLALLDEAMLAVTVGERSPIITGLVYCSVIEACQQVFALSRAREWTSALSRWCEQQPDMVAFSATCLVRRAEILQVHGAWPDALAAADRACERSRNANRNPPGAALYQQAEVHRLRGEYPKAEEAYRGASRLGCEPQPGLALLRVAQGRTDVASAAIRRVMNATSDPLQRAKLLPAYIEVMLATGDMQEADSACREFTDLAKRIDADAVRAMSAHSRGAVELARRDGQAALNSLRQALAAWQALDVPHAAARVRMLIGVACRLLGDEETAVFEFAAAKAAFEQLGAVPDLARLQTLEGSAAPAARTLLTPREIHVLRLVAAGKTNKAIATMLSLSERTIDRHVGNILMKLDVPSRAAAAAYACRHNLV